MPVHPLNYTAPQGGSFTCVSPLVTPRPRLRHRTTCRAGSCNLPVGILQRPQPRFAEDPTGLLRENFFRLRPSPPPSCHKNEKQQRRSKIRRTQKVVRPDNCSIPVEVTLSPGRKTHGQKMKIERKFHLIPLKSWRRKSSLGAGLWRRFLGEWRRSPSDQNLSATRRRSQPPCTFSLWNPLIRPLR
jgi:hypothetical protein